jgi:hypothetical protein
MLGPNHADRLLGQLGRSHALHGAEPEVALGYRPPEGVQAPGPGRGCGRWPASAGELVGDEVLEVLAAELVGRIGWPWAWQ